MGAVIVGSIVLILVALNVVATLRVRSSILYTRSQKLMQLTLIWVVPLVGATLALVVAMSDTSRIHPDSIEDKEPLANAGFGDSLGGGGHDGGGGHGGDGGIGGH